ncbi:hypothetical protein Avbf_02630 [Armadillidium vulgare]|nr:hypothetical protein Avbf_02630 [Armadillidium vulgare]
MKLRVKFHITLMKIAIWKKKIESILEDGELEDDGEEEKYVYDSLEDEGSYLILAPVVARPNSVYRLVVLLYKVDDPSKAITVKASMSSTAGNELTFAETSTVKGESTELMMRLQVHSLDQIKITCRSPARDECALREYHSGSPKHRISNHSILWQEHVFVKISRKSPEDQSLLIQGGRIECLKNSLELEVLKIVMKRNEIIVQQHLENKKKDIGSFEH